MTEAIDDCTEAINLDGTYLKAYLKRAKWYVMETFVMSNSMWTWFKYPIYSTFVKISFKSFNTCSYMETEKYEEAVRDYEKICKMNGSRGVLIYFY